MKFAPQEPEEVNRFIFLTLATTVLGITFCYSQFKTTWLAARALGDWVAVPFGVATVAMGFYSGVMLFRGRILLALLSFIIFAIGFLATMPTL
jgi:hypothetical protein